MTTNVDLQQRMKDMAEMNRVSGRGTYSLMLDTTRPLKGPGPRQAFVCVNCGQRFNEQRADGSLSHRDIKWDRVTRSYVPTKTGAKSGLVSDHIGVYHRCKTR